MYCEALVGHRPLMSRISGLMEGGRLPHAILLSGPAGVGKSVAARCVAAAFLCADSGCGACPDCKRVFSGIHPDFHLTEPEEGHRDILIKQVLKEMIPALAMKSFEGRGKVALIDPADGMNDQTQNSFLKTLEEPPPDTLLILVSSRPERLLSTVLSRSQQFRFGRLDEGEIDAFVASRPGIDERLPRGFAAGCPGRLVRLDACDGGSARRLIADFVTNPSPLSPVAFGVDLFSWAQKASPLVEIRKRVGVFLDITVTFLRDLAVLGLAGEEVPLHLLCNQDLAQRLAKVLPLYDLSLLARAPGEMAEIYADLEGNVDPGLVVENAAILIRKMRIKS
jgi:DNA polymerase III subunit delta'